jgi:hypothetical protein
MPPICYQRGQWLSKQMPVYGRRKKQVLECAAPNGWKNQIKQENLPGEIIPLSKVRRTLSSSK